MSAPERMSMDSMLDALATLALLVVLYALASDPR